MNTELKNAIEQLRTNCNEVIRVSSTTDSIKFIRSKLTIVDDFLTTNKELIGVYNKVANNSFTSAADRKDAQNKVDTLYDERSKWIEVQDDLVSSLTELKNSQTKYKIASRLTHSTLAAMHRL